MLFDPEANENSFFVVPVKQTEINSDVDVDWDFLDIIKNNANIAPQYVNDEIRKTQPFDFNRFKDSVVMPWYRNQDQPQYFYVAEICNHLTPESSFPGENYSTFAEYYHRKYGIEIQNKKQPLLDVDHTSARLNFLTPRYVNRKGVALPTSSEETKRAKRENLEQKQILVPELCTIHPFPASLWRAAVCLPCILYRINALLLADEIRMEVSTDLGLGTLEVIDEKFEWPMLNFGWTLADVLKKAREDKSKHNKVEVEEIEEIEMEKVEIEKTANDLLEEANQKAKSEHLLEIGMWSNEMAQNIDEDSDNDELGVLPRNLELCSTRNIRYGSPTSWDATFPKQVKTKFQDNFLPSESDDDDDDFQSDIEDDDSNGDQNENNDDDYGLKIEFKNDHLAEAFESEEKIKQRQRNYNLFVDKKRDESLNGFDLIEEKLNESIDQHEKSFEKSLVKSKEIILESGNLIKAKDKVSSDIRQIFKNDSNDIIFDASMKIMIPYVEEPLDNQLNLETLYELNAEYQQAHPDEEFEVVGCGDFFDHFSDRQNIKVQNKKKFLKIKIENDSEKIARTREKSSKLFDYTHEQTFGFDYQPDLNNHPGPSPSILLQALTMSNANDGINLERLETIGDSFLKYAITTYLYCTYENVNEGKLSYLRSKQVSNLNLYRLGKKKILGESMIATKFEPQDNWLPPCYFVPKELEQALIDAKVRN
jgi:endoribonuclease Dicer